MSHDTHHNDDRPGSKLTSSVWLVILLVFLFVSAVNFVNVMSAEDEGHGGGHGTEAVEHHGENHGHEAASHHAEDNGHGEEHGHDEAHH